MNFDFITDRIAVGQRIDTAEFAAALRAAGITHVLNLIGGPKECSRERFWADSVCYVPQEDDWKPRTREMIQAAVQYAFSALRAGGGKLYVHCEMGRGRAPAACYAILRHLGFAALDAAALIDAKRPECVGHWRQYMPSVESAL